MLTKKRFYLPSILLITIVLTTGLFQNCSDVNFETTDELLKAGIDGTLRQVSFNPNFTENRPNIDVTTILDNSNSMTKIQGQVKTAVSSTTSALRGFNGTVNLYSTTQDFSHPARNRDRLTYYKIQDEDGNLIPSTTFNNSDLNDYKNEMDEIGNPVFSTYELWTRYTNFSPFRTIPFSGQMSDLQFSTFQQEVFNEIAKFDVSGSSTEVTLCSLLRNIEAYKDSNDFHTYIIATNEDDASSMANCLRAEGNRFDRQSQIQPGSNLACDDTDEDCTFSYTVSYRDEKWSKLVYKKSFVEKEEIDFSLKNKFLKAVTTNISYTTARRLSQHKIKQKSWQYTFQLKVQVGDNDGIPIYENRPTGEDNVKAMDGSCTPGTTSYASCKGSDLSYVTGRHSNYVAGTCQVRCNNSTTAFRYDWIDTENKPINASSPNYEPQANETLSGYTKGCKAFVASKRNYTNMNITDADIVDCNFMYSKDSGTGGNSLGKTTTVSKSGSTKSYANACTPDEKNCTSSEKTNAINAAGWTAVDSSLISCTQSCVQNSLHTILAAKKRVADGQLCLGKSAGDADATVPGSCTAADMTKAKNDLISRLSSNGVTVGSISDSDITCGYRCFHKQGVEQEVSGSKIKLDPWANPSNENKSCSETEFANLGFNIHSCRKVYYNDSGKGSETFNSKDGSICGANSHKDPVPTLAVIRNHPDAVGVPDHGTDQPMNNCTVTRYSDGRSQGTKGGPSSITYNWPSSNTQDSFINDEGVVKNVTDMLNQAHGGNYFVVAFINDPDQEGTLCKGANLTDYYGPSKSLEYEGKRFKELATALGPKHMKTYPACMPDYVDAMKFVFDLVVTSASRIYKLPLDDKAQEWVYRVKVLDSKGLIHTLDENVYSWENGLLTFEEGFDLDKVEMIYVDIVVPNPLTL